MFLGRNMSKIPYLNITLTKSILLVSFSEIRSGREYTRMHVSEQYSKGHNQFQSEILVECLTYAIVKIL